MDGIGFCTATLISETRVLTAAHCLFDRSTGARLPEDRLEFLAGWRNGRAEAIRRVVRSTLPHSFELRAGAEVENVPQDFAILELDRPLRTTAIRPFAVAAASPARGTPVAVVSYGRNRAEAPAIQETCHVLEQHPSGLTILSCSIEPGSSGSPVFMMNAQGEPEIVSVISASAEGASARVALGMQLGDRAQLLASSLDNGLGAGSSMGAAGARMAARFLRP